MTEPLPVANNSVRRVAGNYAINEVLTYPAIRAPWAILGYSDELHRAFKKDPDGFCAAVEERRRELQ
jgi:hypothetical protein